MERPYDAVLLISFGGPERPEDVLPFLENVLQGTNVPRQRMLDVASHYDHFDGASPLGPQLRALLAAVVAELNAHHLDLPVYWGNRNWHPMLADTLSQMADDGVTRTLGFVTSAFGSYSGCRKYLEDIETARQAVGPTAPEVDKLRLFYNHPGFIEPMADRVASAVAEVPDGRRDSAVVVFSAHSIPNSMAERCDYQHQLEEACRLVAERAGLASYRLAYQSRSGPPSQPWLGPGLDETLRQLAEEKNHDVVIVPIGFLLENMEVVYDLDIEAGDLCEQLGINMVRAAVVGCHPRFVQMIRELIVERIEGATERPALGNDGAPPDVCPADCCRRA